MPNYHKSIEVYKTIHTDQGYKLFPVRGLYVSGEHLEPSYSDHLISLQSWNSNPAEIVDYTFREVPIEPDHNVNLIDLSFADINLITYSTSSYDLPHDHIVNLLDLIFEEPTLTDFRQSTVSLSQDHNVNLLECEFTDVTLVTMSQPDMQRVCEPIIMLNSFTSSTAEITSIT